MTLQYRESNEQDLEQIRSCVAEDSSKTNTTPEFFLPARDENGKNIPGIKCIAVEDKHGVVFYLRLEQVMRVHVAFVPKNDYYRIREALKEAFIFIGSGAKKIGYHEMIFDSVSKLLVRFCQKFLGFSDQPNTLSTKL